MTQTTQAQQTAKNLFYLPMPSRPLCPICDGGNAKSKAICHHNLNKVEDIGVGTSWDIGRKSRNCGAFGLCRCSSITFEYSQRVKSNKNSFNSTISLTTEKRVLFSVDKENMLIISNYFKGEQLILDEDFVIDDKEVLSKLHLESYTLKKGLYKFKFNIKSSKFEVII
ncbi:MAG TPA: hypothetical protein DIU01_03495 [Flavobacterium sp.]|nr:hypothetical protein [Flavobacterium sp.]